MDPSTELDLQETSVIWAEALHLHPHLGCQSVIPSAVMNLMPQFDSSKRCLNVALTFTLQAWGQLGEFGGPIWK